MITRIAAVGIRRSALVLLALALAGCSSNAAKIGDAELLSQRLVSAAMWLEGTFSSADQASADERYFEVVLHHARIWPEREDGFWFYVEQAIASAQDRPYRQRIYRVWLRPDRVLESAVYELPDPDRYAGAWSTPGVFGELSTVQLSKREGCEVVFTEFGRIRTDPWMRGETADGSCSSELRGAAYATSEVLLTPDEIRSWDRGYNADGEQVWGAEDGPYVFKRVD